MTHVNDKFSQDGHVNNGFLAAMAQGIAGGGFDAGNHVNEGVLAYTGVVAPAGTFALEDGNTLITEDGNILVTEATA